MPFRLATARPSQPGEHDVFEIAGLDEENLSVGVFVGWVRHLTGGKHGLAQISGPNAYSPATVAPVYANAQYPLFKSNDPAE